MIIELLLLIIGFVCLVVSTYTDIRWREVPDFISFFCIFSALILRLLESIITSNWIFFIYGLIGAGIGFIIGLIMYQLGQWGGGDAKLIIGLFSIFSTTPIFLFGNLFFNFPGIFLIVFFFNILFCGAAYSLIYAIVILIKRFNPFKKEVKHQYTMHKKIISIITIICSIIFIVGISYYFLVARFTFTNITLSLLIIGIPIYVILMTFLFICTKAVEQSCFIKKYPVEKLTEGDWVMDEIKNKNKIIYSSKDLGISKEQIALLKKYKITTVTVKEGIPFVPAFLLAFLVSFFIGNWLYLILI